MFEFNKPTVVFITGPTAIGKTSLSIQLAMALNTQIISCDSRQFYREMTIGTAVPNEEKLDQVKHHFIQHKSIHDSYTPGNYETDALVVLNQYFQSHKVIILVGGPSLYAHGLLYGLHKFPEISPQIRLKLRNIYDKKGIKFLQNQLKEKDLEYFQMVDQDNPRRLLRALEIIEQSGNKYSELIKKKKSSRNFESIVINLEVPKKDLYQKINQRVDKMMHDGLLNEVESLWNYRKLPPLNTIGYKELFDYLSGRMTLDTTVSEIKKNSRRFAKRQITFSKRFKNPIHLKAPFTVDEISNQVQKLGM